MSLGSHAIKLQCRPPDVGMNGLRWVRKDGKQRQRAEKQEWRSREEKKRTEETRKEDHDQENSQKNKILCFAQHLIMRTYGSWRRGGNQRVRNFVHVSQRPISCFVWMWWRFLCGSNAPDSNTLSLSRQRWHRTADCVKEGFVHISHLLFVRISGEFLLSS